MKNRKMKNRFFTILALLLPVFLIAQPNPGGPGGPPIDDDVPIDNAIVWLLVLGVAFGVYMVYKQQRKAVR